MCRLAQCSDCGKATFAGCGMHVEAVLAGVPADERCRCREAAAVAVTATATSPLSATGRPAQKRGWLDLLTGK